jgi:cytochrome c oxidase subunit I
MSIIMSDDSTSPPVAPSSSRDASLGCAPEVVSGRRWLGLAVGSLVLAGLLSLSLVLGRMPPFDRLVTDPQFFRRCLVVHVDLSLVVWFYAFVAALLSTLPKRGESSRVSRAGVFVSTVGVALLVLSAGAPGSRPIVSNYVPMIDHPLFAAGLVAFGAGVLVSFTDARLFPDTPTGSVVLLLPDAAIPGLRATAIALLLAALTFAGSWWNRPSGLVVDTLFELANWGGGHVLQLASTCAMLSVWLILLAGVLGRSPVSRRTASGLFGVLLLPWLAAPLLAAKGIQDVDARTAFTHLMRFAIFPVVLAFLVLCVRALVKARRSGELSAPGLRDPRALAFAVSATLALVGAILGALIRGSTTMVPAHYHASIGAVTAAFMGVAYPLLAGLGYPLPTVRQRALARLQPVVYGTGQLVFAVGFALAGAGGMARKSYGHEQAARSLGSTAGLFVMGLGGLLAVAGGLLFLVIVIVAWRSRHAKNRGAEVRSPPWRSPWNKPSQSIHSSG